MFSLKVDDEIELGLLESRHAPPLLDLTLQSREHLREWMPLLGNLQTVEETGDFIKAGLKRFSENNGCQLGIWYKGELAGTIGYKHWHWETRQTELVYWLGLPFTSHGIMTRATRKLVEYAFGELGLNRVEIQCATGNQASRAVPERLGFVQEAILRQVFWKYDHFLDLVVYGMLANEWGK